MAEDADSFDNFGWSVRFRSDTQLAIVGAPTKEDAGELEQQTLACTADDGTFTVSYRGFTSEAIPFNVTYDDFLEALQSEAGPCMSCYSGVTADPMPVFPALEVTAWTGGLCEPTNGTKGGPAVTITFLTPVTQRPDGDLEPLEVDDAKLSYNGVAGAGNVTVVETRRGSFIPHGPYATGEQRGAAYVFRARSSLLQEWTQEAKLLASGGGSGSRFGWAVDMFGDVAVVGAPGEDSERGAVYVFVR